MDIGTILSDDEIAVTSESEDEDDGTVSSITPSSSTKKSGTRISPSLFDLLVPGNQAENDDVSSSWDFKTAIQTLKNNEGKGNLPQSSIDEKIRRVVERRRRPAKEATKSATSTTGDEEEEEVEERDVLRQLSTSAPSIPEPQPAAAAAAQSRATSFSSLQLSRPLLRVAQALNFSAPTPIQSEAIPLILAGKDVLASAVTGSGKTAAYLFPVIERLLMRDVRSGPVTRILILVPTRELAEQVHSMFAKLTQFAQTLSSVVVVGGMPMPPQAAAIRSRPDVLVATPGRLIDHLRNTQSFDIQDLEILILDEADRLLELGFADSLAEIIKHAPVQGRRQTLLFSATMGAEVAALADLSLSNPVKVATDPLFNVAQRLVQEFVRVRKVASLTEDEEEQIRRQEALLLTLCQRTSQSRTIIFFTHKRQAHRSCVAFGLVGLRCAELHGNLTQVRRLEALERFRTNQVDFLFCTDLAARGIDIPEVSCVINFDLPKDLTTYVHRVGRTARAGRGGRAISLVGEDRRSTMKELLKSSSSSQFLARTVSSALVQAAYSSLLQIAPELESIVGEERVEREIRLAERDATKAENVVLHREEIMSRPKKTWFQSKREADEVRAQSKEAYEGVVVPSPPVEKKKENKQERPGNRAKRRRTAAREQEERDRRKELRADPDGTTASTSTTEVRQKIAARNAKRQSRRGGNDDESGARKKRVGNARVEDEDVVLKQTVKRKVMRSRLQAESGGETENFVEKRSRAFEKESFKPQTTPLRKGGKKGQHKFKSKQKFKRR